MHKPNETTQHRKKLLQELPFFPKKKWPMQFFFKKKRNEPLGTCPNCLRSLVMGAPRKSPPAPNPSIHKRRERSKEEELKKTQTKKKGARGNLKLKQCLVC